MIPSLPVIYCTLGPLMAPNTQSPSKIEMSYRRQARKHMLHGLCDCPQCPILPDLGLYKGMGVPVSCPWPCALGL